MKILQEILNLQKMFSSHPLWRSNVFAPWGRFIHFQLVSMFSSSPRCFQWIPPLQLIVPKRSGLTGHLYCGLMDFEEMMFMLHYLNQDALFIDVGANVGVYSLLASGLKHCQSIAFEPVPETYSQLKEHVRLNHLENRIQCISMGVGESEGVLRLSNSGKNCLSHVLKNPTSGDDGIAISVTTLDVALKNRSVSMIKLDIEGYELFALRGGERLLHSESLKAIILEFNLHAERYGVTPHQIEDLLIEAGFTCCRYDPMDRTLSPTPFNTDGNSIWIKDAASLMKQLKEAEAISICDLKI